MEDLIEKIIFLIENNVDSINDSKELITRLNTKIESKLDNDTGKCCFDLPSNAKRKETLDENQQTGLKLEPAVQSTNLKDLIYEALMKRVKEVVRSDDHTVEASGRISELVKYLADTFLSTVKKPTEKSDGEILEFIKQHDSYVSKFIDSECQRSVTSCLSDRLQEKSDPILVFAHDTNFTPNVKVKESVENDPSQNIISHTSDGSVASKPALVTSLEKVHSSAELKTYPTNYHSEKMPEFMKLATGEDQSMISDGGAIGKIVVFEEIKMSDSENEENTETVSTVYTKPNLSIVDENGKPVSIKTLHIMPKLHPRTSKNDFGSGELIEALDNALHELEINMRDKLFEKSKEPKENGMDRRSSRASIFRSFGVV